VSAVQTKRGEYLSSYLMKEWGRGGGRGGGGGMPPRADPAGAEKVSVSLLTEGKEGEEAAGVPRGSWGTIISSGSEWTSYSRRGEEKEERKIRRERAFDELLPGECVTRRSGSRALAAGGGGGEKGEDEIKILFTSPAVIEGKKAQSSSSQGRKEAAVLNCLNCLIAQRAKGGRKKDYS